MKAWFNTEEMFYLNSIILESFVCVCLLFLRNVFKPETLNLIV